MKLIDADDLIKHEAPAKSFGPEMLVIGKGFVISSPEKGIEETWRANAAEMRVDAANYETRRLRSALEKIAESASTGDWGTDLGCMRGIAKMALDFDAQRAVCCNDGLGLIARLLDERGFRLGRGTYHHGNGDILPTVVINRPDTPEWAGVWTPWEAIPELPGEVVGEEQAAFGLAGTAILEWELRAWMYEPNARDQESPENQSHKQEKL
jgi:hypothetical protein